MFTNIPSRHAMLSDPGGATPDVLTGHGVMLSSAITTASTTHVYQFSRLNHFNLAAYGLPVSLSTLNSYRYLHESKTRSRVR